MGHATDESASDFKAWLDANELRAPRDFKFAFTSAHKAAEACGVAPQTASDAWTSISLTEVEVPSSWTLWVKSHHDAKQQGSAKLHNDKPTSRIWRGLQRGKHKRDQGPTNDAVQRQAAAKDVLRIALSWKERGRLAVEWCRIHPTKRDAWVDMQIARIATTDANTIRSAIRTWRHWCAWCQAHTENPLDPTDAAPAAFLYAPTQTGHPSQVPKTAPTTRFNHLRWLETFAGAPVHLQASDRPSRHTAHGGLPPEQRPASDPEVHVRLDSLLTKLHKTDPTRIVVAIIQLLWMSVLRFQHMQRSIPLRLTAHFLYGLCWKGKGKPGYRWACPRHGPAGADVGGCVWDAWASLPKGAGGPPFGLLYNNGSPLSLAQFHTASRSVLANGLGMKDADIFSSYSLRRSMPTLAEMNETHPDDADALGDWTAARSCKMRIRYADNREERAAVVKLTHVLLVRRLACTQTPLSWDACRHLLCSTDKTAVSSQANQMMACDSTQHETPARMCDGFSRPKRRFNIAALPRRTGHVDQGSALGSTAMTNHLPVSEDGALDSSQPKSQVGANRRWIMVKHKGAPHVHLMPEEGDIPLCRRRRGRLGKPITRLQSMGVGLPDLIRVGWSGPDAVCSVCFAALPDEERDFTR